MSNNQQIWLSPTKLNLFQECPLCFWLQEVKGIHRPQAPFPTLPGGMDILIKKYFDKYRAQGEMVPELEGKVQGKLFSDQLVLNQWRYWKNGLKYEDSALKAVLCGALDECLVDGEFYIPADYKTRGFNLKEDSLSYYQTQLDCYTLLIEAAGYKHLSFGYLIYYIPEEVQEGGMVRFRIEPHRLETSPQRAREIFAQAVKLLRSSQPASHSQCQYCSWGNDFVE